MMQTVLRVTWKRSRSAFLSSACAAADAAAASRSRAATAAVPHAGVATGPEHRVATGPEHGSSGARSHSAHPTSGSRLGQQRAQRAVTGQEDAGRAAPSTTGAAGDDGLLAGGIWNELRSWARFLLPSKYVAVFYRTPPEVARTMLKLARVGPADVVYDLGCGDGSIVLVAAQQLGAKHVVGIELDPQLASAAQRAVEAAGAAHRASIVCGDAAGADVSDATVIALYLSASGNRALLQSIASTLRRGTRVVSLYFPVEGWDGSLAAHDTSCGIDIYLYEAP